MRLKSIQYSQYEGKPNEWRLEDCTLGDINLIVGKNATGKTRTLNVISGLANSFSGDLKQKLDTGNWDFVFDNDGEDIRYLLKWKSKHVIHEEFIQGGKTLLQRGADGTGKIYAEQLNLHIDFQPPSDELAVVSRRDTIQHSFLDRLYVWGEDVRHFRFGTPMGQNRLVVYVDGLPEQELNLKNPDYVVEIFRQGQKKHKADYLGLIIADMKKIGYELEDISIQSIQNVAINQTLAEASGISVKEKDLDAATFQGNISTGMFRALSLFIQLNYSLLDHLPSCILIDDIGEGLDFSRSAALIGLLIEKVKGTQVQLIMATNNRFVMNRVPLEYWSVIRRVPNGARIYNYRNSKAIFDDFEFTGLSNFDFFSSDYLENALSQEPENQ
jgi:energy-coupling factor transporter ATP-binding protein EcfA2